MFAGLIQTPVMSSDEVVFSPTSEPSKYSNQVPLVVDPRDVGEKAIKSSSLPETPVTLKEPRVLMINFPSGTKSMASTSSASVVKPTSEPSKYHWKVPVVVSPVEVGMKRMISESSTLPKPLMVAAASRDMRILPSGIKAKASTSPVTPTSEPSKYMLHVPVAVLYETISSSLYATPPELPFVDELT